jgi:hypothetical protein
MTNSAAFTPETIIVAFHIGRGGRFNNSGFKSYLGEKDFQNLINLNDNDLFTKNRDDNGRFVKPFLANIGSGSSVTDDDITGKVGVLNFDYDYNTDYAQYIEDCDEHEIELICNSSEYKTGELVEYLKAVTEYDFDKYGIKIELEDEY